VVTFRSTESGYAVVKLRVTRADNAATVAAGQVTLVGSLSHLGKGQRMRAQGSWVSNERFGPQFKARRRGEADKPSALAHLLTAGGQH